MLDTGGISGGVLQPRLTFEQQLKLGSATAEPGVLPRGHWQPNMSLLKQLDLLNHLWEKGKNRMKPRLPAQDKAHSRLGVLATTTIHSSSN
ncbi:hypothetical protein ACET3Z_020046 [Daucus carota]